MIHLIAGAVLIVLGLLAERTAKRSPAKRKIFALVGVVLFAGGLLSIFAPHLVAFMLRSPWHATWLGVVEGLALVFLGILSLFTAKRSTDQRDTFASVGVFLIAGGLFTTYAGISLGVLMGDRDVMINDTIQQYYHTRKWQLPVLPVTSLGVVAALLLMMSMGAILIVAVRRMKKRLLVAAGAVLMAATFTLAADIALYHLYWFFLNQVVEIGWIFTLGTSALLVKEIRIALRDRAERLAIEARLAEAGQEGA